MTTSHLHWDEKELMGEIGNIRVTPSPISPEDAAQGYSWTCQVTFEKTTEEQEAYKKELFDYLKGCAERGTPLYYSFAGIGRIGITVVGAAKGFIEPELKKRIEQVCLRGPRVLNGIAPTQEALDSFLNDTILFPTFPNMTFLTGRRFHRQEIAEFHHGNHFFPQEYINKALAAARQLAQPSLRSKTHNLNNKNMLAPDPEMMVVLASDPYAAKLTLPLSTDEKSYKRSEVQQWRNDAVSSCIDIANRFKVDSRVIAEFKKLIETPKESN